MSQFMVKRYSGGDKPETDYFSVDADDELAAAMKACGGAQLIRGAKPGDLRCPYPLTKIGRIERHEFSGL